MSTQHTDSIQFSKSKDSEFTTILRKRVFEYFSENNISRFGNSTMISKTIIMIALYFVPYIISISGIITSPVLYILLWVIMGLGMAGIGASIMHDANHGAYSKYQKVNKLLGYMLNIIGGNAVNWKIQHNTLHHQFTNITGVDEDISRIKILRFSPFEEHKTIHRFQHIYAWFLYGLMTLSWVTKKEFVQLIEYKQKGLTKNFGSFSKLFSELIFWKLIYFSYAIVLPLLLLPFSAWIIVLAFVLMQFVAGFFLSIVFQTAHVMPDNEYPLPNNSGNIDDAWTVHQLKTTANFSEKSRIFSWIIGGLNYQIEHHLFPSICHVHYKAISKIVEKTAIEFGIPYNKEKTFFNALYKHALFLKQLGKRDFVMA